MKLRANRSNSFKKILLLILFVAIVLAFLGIRGWNRVPTFIGREVEAAPMQSLMQPQHPFLATSERSSMHGGSYNQDVNDYPGPLGTNTRSVHRSFNKLVGVAPNIAFDSKGRLITVSIQINAIELHLLDPNTLETIAMVELPEKEKFSDNSGGGYFHIDHQDRVLLAPADKTIKIFEVVENENGPSWRVAESYDLSDILPEGAHIHDIIPDWEGNPWFVTLTGFIGYLDKENGEIHTFQLENKEESIQNSLAVDEEGLYIVSSDALYQFKTDSLGKIYYTWRENYESGGTQKPGTLSPGSGTSPTLIGEDLVTIADDGDPHTNIMVYKRKEFIEGERVVDKVPLFEISKSATENSVLVYGNAMIVQNDFGHDFKGNAHETSPGVMRIDVREDRSACDVIWYNKEFVSLSLPRLSTSTGLLYFYTFRKQKPSDFFGGWYLTALNFSTGEELWSQLISPGTGKIIDPLTSVTAPVVLGENGAAYVGIRTGIVMAIDSK